MRKTTRKMWAAAAGVTGIALVATACSGSDAGDDSSAPSDEKITLTISTFNEFGYDDLLDEYMQLNPNITIEHNKFATSNEARDQFSTALAAGSGLADVVAVEVDWMPEIKQYADQFNDLTSDSVTGRWNDWTTKQATTEDGVLLAYPTDIGPEAIAYRADLFAAAGLPSDRESVKALFEENGGDWDQFFKVGQDFVAASNGVPFFDGADAVGQGMLNQLDAPFENPDTGEIALDPQVQEIYNTLLENTNLSSHKAQWGEDWVNAFQNNGFAVMLAPSWMLGVIEGNAAGVTGWDIADTFPGGGGNWGGSFLTVPTQSEHPEEAKAFADWLTAPEQQLKAFATTGNFPSQVEAQASTELAGMTNEFFNNAPTGEIFKTRSEAISVIPFKGENYFAVRDALSQAINRVDVDQTDDAATSWATFEEAVKAIG
ncbi:ABC transporter substrate-binding protein [Cellulomonas soli]|uniref:Sugar ABC transporter substrate-binding protein n=1 Tax=Cellulomonas soli TaxID=931535 RepID=A0A512P8D1_9CELL|nr:ABC transporter substrate-binding protein [Cellulomonas soli]NYI57605.1 cellobiose transport system substrate-binding protein [Cellulomonas soli]GEP67382.1 sugar ABC transporter substrate-binding protein [Cellulomonas soli]